MQSTSDRPPRAGAAVFGMRNRMAPPAIIAGLFLLLHLPFLAPSLEDFDSINFGLALHHYDPTNNRPHPPGYPVYIAAGRASLALVHWIPGVDAIRADALALALLSAVCGAVALIAAWHIFSLLTGERSRVALWATLLLAASPLFWMTALRPMSDMPGLALVLVAQACLLQSLSSAGRPVDSMHPDGAGRPLVWGALAMGVAIGVRSQATWLTLPWFVAALVVNRRKGVMWLVSRPCTALVAGGLAWAVPMVASVGGVSPYLQALTVQAGGDFAAVDMLWLDLTVRHLAHTLRESLVLPWESVRLAYVVIAVALAGAALAAVRDRRALGLVLLGFAPYAVFHLLFQETAMVRYALPLVVPMVFLAACAIEATRRPAPVIAVALATAALFAVVPTSVAYGRDPHPTFQALRGMLGAAPDETPGKVFAHHALARTLQVDAAASLPVVEPPERYEWLGAVDYWRSGGNRPVWFLADPGRSDLALIDPQSLRTVTRYRWRVGGRRTLAGTRPLDADWYRINPPGWFAGAGWSLSLEAGGVTAAAHSGLDRGPIDAYVRRRHEPTWLLVGGRDLAAPASVPSRLELTIDGRMVDGWTFDPSMSANFLRTVALPDGVPDGPGAYATLTITARAVTPGAPTPPVAIRQFDIQSAPTLMFGFGEGWHEEEFDSRSASRWRWTSDRSLLQVVPPQGVTLRLRGESPLKYFDAAPTVRVRAGDREIAVLHPAADFDWRVTVPAAAMALSNGSIAIEIDRVYLPGKVEGTSDARRLGLRLFEVDVYPFLP